MTVGLLLLLVANLASWAAIRQISHREAQHAVERCSDPDGNRALRKQWTRVAELIRRTQLPPTHKDYLPPKEASKQFAKSYNDAVREAGRAPMCLDGDG